MAQRTDADRLKQHRESVGQFRPIVFCVKCGSTCVDQNSLTELRCYTCGNTLPWDAASFSIRRNADPHGESDVKRAIERTP
jgi:ribosomal protein S27E